MSVKDADKFEDCCFDLIAGVLANYLAAWYQLYAGRETCKEGSPANGSLLVCPFVPTGLVSQKLGKKLIGAIDAFAHLYHCWCA